jgi:hypothetical protein
MARRAAVAQVNDRNVLQRGHEEPAKKPAE